MSDLGNFSSREYLRLHGALPERHIEHLIDIETQFNESRDVTPYLQEAKGSYPSEDFLEEVIEMSRALEKRLRGENRNSAALITIALEEVQTKVRGESEYGADELKKALKEINSDGNT